MCKNLQRENNFFNKDLELQPILSIYFEVIVQKY